MVKKKLDSRIKTLIEANVKKNQRSMFVMIGDKGRDQIVHLHYMLSKASTTRPSVLWCYKKELGFSSHRQKRMKQIKKMQQKGLLDPEKDDPFELFISSTDIRYTYYKETDKILGNTYGMCILQDFEALTPNLLARTIETVQGGGLIVFLLQSMNSLKQLYAMTMDVHSRYRTEGNSSNDIVARFNERFLLSLSACESCLVMDDQWNVLPLSNHIKNISDLESLEVDDTLAKELKDLKDSLMDTQPAGNLVQTAKTLDQAKAILTFIDAISEKSLRNTVALTASRGRGKSAALGIAMAASVAYGYSNIFVTSPSPENLKTLFQFVLKGFDALGYEEHLDYDLVQSTHPEFNKAIVRINIHREHRQTIQYIQPEDHMMLGQAELLIIDEAAAIPLPVIKNLLGNHLVFMASTINGYEGTGRSLSLKLFKQLREKQFSDKGSSGLNRSLKEIALEEPIRYSKGDPIESWLNQLLCLDATIPPKVSAGCPHPDECDLYYVHRDTLFSYHKASEQFLQSMMSLYVASHYKNTPNDLQLMSDAPSHHLFVLLAPVKEDQVQTQLPEILCVLQVSLEGEISKQSIMNSLTRGIRSSGDLIPWTISQQFQEDAFAALSGARIVRIATHPDYQGMGYGKRAMNLLKDFFSNSMNVVDDGSLIDVSKRSAEVESVGELQTEQLAPKRHLPPLLLKLDEIKPMKLDWLGVSFGLTNGLLKFWKGLGYAPVYLRQTKNEITGEHTCIMLQSLTQSNQWLSMFWLDFRNRFTQLLSYQFKDFNASIAMSILEQPKFVEVNADRIKKEDLPFNLYDLKRLSSYTKNMVDYHMILDMLPTIAEHVLKGKIEVGVSPVQSAILIAMGSQRKLVEDISKELNLPVSQVLAMFSKLMHKVSAYYDQLHVEALEKDEEKEEKEVSEFTKDAMVDENWDPTTISLEDELEEAGDEVSSELREKQRELINSLDLSQYAIGGDEKEWNKALKKSNLKTLVSIKNPESSKKRKFENAYEQVEKEKKEHLLKKSGKKK